MTRSKLLVRCIKKLLTQTAMCRYRAVQPTGSTLKFLLRRTVPAALGNHQQMGKHPQLSSHPLRGPRRSLRERKLREQSHLKHPLHGAKAAHPLPGETQKTVIPGSSQDVSLAKRFKKWSMTSSIQSFG